MFIIDVKIIEKIINVHHCNLVLLNHLPYFINKLYLTEVAKSLAKSISFKPSQQNPTLQKSTPSAE